MTETPEQLLHDRLTAFRRAESTFDNAAQADRDNRPVMAAAQALLAVAADRHHVEETARIYLVLRPGGWEVDSPTFDGYPLEGYDGGPVTSECECDAPAECDTVRRAAAWLPLPTARQLTELLRAHR